MVDVAQRFLDRQGKGDLHTRHQVLNMGHTVGEASSWRQHLRHDVPMTAQSSTLSAQVAEGAFAEDFLDRVREQRPARVVADADEMESFAARGFWTAVQLDDDGTRRGVGGHYASAWAESD